MSLKTSDITNTPFLFDKVGRVVIQKDKVYRVISDKKFIDLYKKVLSSKNFSNLFSEGLIETIISFEDIERDLLVLEHKKLNFFLHPSEYTNKMFWDSAVMFIKLSKRLYDDYGLLTLDSHPWNMTFDGVNPIFFDFSSLYEGKEVSQNWLNEFEKYFAIPIQLASYSKKTNSLAIEYRREHIKGFGLTILNKRLLKKILSKKFKSLSKSKDNPIIVFDEILNWLEKNKPINANTEYWSNYEQAHLAEIDIPKTVKQKFVYENLKEFKPKTVLDLASNKGFYAMMANKLGTSVIAFDYEEETVNSCIKEVSNMGLNVTPALMDFNYPTSASGIGLMNKDSYTRLGSDIVLSLGLIHHICLIQKTPVFIFCEICKQYANKGIILEFVDASDIHVKNWNVEIPSDYSIDSITSYMSDKFSKVLKSQVIDHDGINRIILFFYK